MLCLSRWVIPGLAAGVTGGPAGAGSRLSPRGWPAVDCSGSRPSLISQGEDDPARRRLRPVLAWSLAVLSGVGHDAVVGPAGAGAVAAEHLRGDPAVEFHQVALGAAAVRPGVAEVVPEPFARGRRS
jgi:hypothetical protein